MTGLMPADPVPVPVGSTATVEQVSTGPVGQIYVTWDHPCRLILLPTDPFEILAPADAADTGAT